MAAESDIDDCLVGRAHSAVYYSLFRIRFTSSTQIKPLQMAFGRTTNILYSLTSYLLNS